MTGTWMDSASGIVYRFFDDSRFQQSDMLGEQWIWETKADRVFLHGSPERLWRIEYETPDLIQVIETDTFKIQRI